MKASIRAKLNGEAPKKKNGLRGQARISFTSKLSRGYVGWVIDKQSKEELAQREMAAKVQAFRLSERLAKAQATNEKCSHKACPYLAVFDGECRRHAADRLADFSVLPSQLGPARELADY